MVDMDCLHMLRVQPTHKSRNIRAPITPLHNVPIIPKLQHELMERFCVMLVLETGLLGTLREAIARQGRGYNVEAGFIENRQNLGDLGEGAWPPMYEEKRHSSFRGGRRRMKE
ncbi:MAG: hypothetical protein Q9205_007206, partial [Flavoplaca limonia]